ncbi:hypothetical protein BANRA_04952 [Pseudomonas aeruginosa]|nr:hypothetical protein BANRA_04952 [Pseudomonas aeruginosa]
MNMFATQGGVVELWVTKTDTYTSTKTGGNLRLGPVHRPDPGRCPWQRQGIRDQRIQHRADPAGRHRLRRPAGALQVRQRGPPDPRPFRPDHQYPGPRGSVVCGRQADGADRPSPGPPASAGPSPAPGPAAAGPGQTRQVPGRQGVSRRRPRCSAISRCSRRSGHRLRLGLDRRPGGLSGCLRTARMEGSVSVQVCKTWVQNADGTVGCTHLEWIQTYLLPPEAEGYFDSADGWFRPVGLPPRLRRDHRAVRRWFGGWLDHFRHAQSAQLMRFQSWKK